jgi:hypothetical protein
MFRHDLIFREPEPCSTLETALEDDPTGQVGLNLDSEEVNSWDEILAVDEEKHDSDIAA